MKASIELATVHLGSLSPAPWRATHVLKPDLKLLTESIREYGVLSPLVVRKESMTIIDGFHRYVSLQNDKALLTPLHKLMDEADIIIGQNSNAFDLKKLNSKFLEHSMGVPSPFKKIDTYLLAKRHFSLTSNKLEYMSKKFNKTYKKQDHEEFSGFKLWDECLKGNLKAWNCMQKYNNFDVLATEELFLRLAEFDKTEVVASAIRAFNNKK